MTKEEIIPTLLGQTIEKHSTWNGGTTTVTIESVEVKDGWVNVVGAGKMICIPMSLIEHLLLTGNGKHSQEIDHCTVVDSYFIIPSDTQRIEQRIDYAKQRIKDLKKELKRLQEMHSNMLVSDVRLMVLRGNHE